MDWLLLGFIFVSSIDRFSSFKPETKPEAPGWLPTLDLFLNSGKSSEVLVEGTKREAGHKMSSKQLMLLQKPQSNKDPTVSRKRGKYF